MKLSEIKSKLKELDTIAFELLDGTLIASHFHVTEVGKVSKQFIYCGGIIKHEDEAHF